MGKYIIELERGETAYKTVDLNGTPLIQLLDPLPYTEPDTEQVREEAYEDGYKTAKVQCNIQAEKDLREVGKRHYQKGLSDAWDAARKIAKLNTDEQKRLFGCFGIYFVAHEFSASEAIEKIRQYEEQEEIKVGSAEDVVPVVRCENCVHWSDSNQCERPELTGNRWHDDKYFETLPDDFCSYGERKED